MAISSPRASQTQPVCLQITLNKYNQQYHKLFKDVPLEEVVLKGELSPWYSWLGIQSAWGQGPLLWSLQSTT